MYDDRRMGFAGFLTNISYDKFDLSGLEILLRYLEYCTTFYVNLSASIIL